MRVYNTLGGRKEELRTLNPHKVNMYVCGPTVYNFIHLGNARPLVVFDSLRRYLEYKGYDVTYIQNFTDVDDKIIRKAQEENDDPLRLAERYIGEYFIDADRLNIKRASVHPQVSQHIPDIIDAVGGLIDKGHAYEVDGDVYFRVRSFPEYGKLSGRAMDEMLAGARVEVDERKDDPADFALWKAAKPGEPYWDSPWGQGRPGWHIECSVMSTRYLGDSIDIHGGGSDLIFPHHENEIAQAEALTGQPFSRYWMHNGFITVNKEKMSKSLGNFFLLRDILTKFPADVVRFYLIATHYRSPLDFDDGKLEEARKALGRLKNTLLLADEFLRGNNPDTTDLPEENRRSFDNITEQFAEALDDDFNTALAIAHLFELSRLINSHIASGDPGNSIHQAIVGQGADILRRLGDVLGLFGGATVFGNVESEDDDISSLEVVLESFLAIRQQARQDKDYARADEIRNFLSGQGIRIEDTSEGARCRYEAPPDLTALNAKLEEMQGGR
ncbi:MAG: cysteine--tRNA ligase [Syntrophomonadaceae bacterium]|nr:cysteine--tRNA ligase [Syntrophomonadaceae bacterium]